VDLALRWRSTSGRRSIHLALAAGCVLLAFSFFDFELPRWINRTRCAAALALGTIFLLQALALLIPEESLYYLAYQVLGQWPEGWLPDLVILWFVAMLLIDSRGKTRILGLVAMSLVVCLELYSHILALLGTSLSAEAGTLKLLLLMPFVWSLCESTKKRPKKGL
jgi:O-antigen ligase